MRASAHVFRRCCAASTTEDTMEHRHLWRPRTVHTLVLLLQATTRKSLGPFLEPVRTPVPKWWRSHLLPSPPFARPPRQNEDGSTCAAWNVRRALRWRANPQILEWGQMRFSYRKGLVSAVPGGHLHQFGREKERNALRVTSRRAIPAAQISPKC